MNNHRAMFVYQPALFRLLVGMVAVIISFAAIGWIVVFVFWYLTKGQDLSASLNHAKRGLLFGLAPLFPIVGFLLLGLGQILAETFKQRWEKWWNSRQFVILENLEKENLKDMEDSLDNRLAEMHTLLLQVPNPSKPLDYEVENIKGCIRTIRSKESVMLKKKAVRDFLLGILLQVAFWVGLGLYANLDFFFQDTI